MNSYSTVEALNNIWKRLRTAQKEDACIWSISAYGHPDHNETTILRHDILEPNLEWYLKQFPIKGNERIDLCDNIILIISTAVKNDSLQEYELKIVFHNKQDAANFSQLLHEKRADVRHAKL